MSDTKNEIVLVDSDDSNGEEIRDHEDASHYNQPPTKRHKPLSVTPFNDRSSSSSFISENDDSRQHGEEDGDDDGQEEDSGEDFEGKEIHTENREDDDDDDEEDEDDEEEDAVEVLSLPSSLAPSSQTNIQIINSSDSDEDDDSHDHEHHHDHHDHEQDYDSDEDSELDTVSFEQVGAISPALVAETRKYLKQNGTLKFLEKYLPTAASSEDILKLILKLGFFPRDLPRSLHKKEENNDSNSNNEDVDNEDLMRLIGILNRAIIKVKSIRNRLDEVQTIEDALKLLKTSKKILVITGAGISTSLGIPDFRSSQGFYNQLQHLGLSDPQEVFDLQLFLTDPSLFYSIAYMILPPEEIYSPLHSFIKLLQSRGKLLRNYTQNIDNLESYAGISSSKLIQCHGSFATATCITCKYQIKGEVIFDKIRNKEIPYCPKCTKTRNQLLRDDEEVYIAESFGVFKPDITFFGEPLPKTFHDMINEDLHECDLLISIGTSLKVAPVADIVDKVPPEVPQILINKDPIDHCNFDISLLGYCDDVASYLANELGEGWDLPHEKFNEIRGLDPEGSNLEISLTDEDRREYEIVNLITREKEDLEAAAIAAEIAVNSNDDEDDEDEEGEKQGIDDGDEQDIKPAVEIIDLDVES